MIKFNLFFVIGCLLLSAQIPELNAQWQPDVRLTNDTADSHTSFNNAWCIAVSGNDVHIVWQDNRDGNYEIYYKRSTNAGLSWGADTRLTSNSAGSNNPSVVVSGLVVHVVWYDSRDGNFEIYYKRSTDGGSSWGADTRLTNNSADSGIPSVAVSGSDVHVVWFDYRDGNNEIYYKRSADGGISWGTDTRLTSNSAYSQYSSITVSSQVVHVVWQDNRDGNFEIYYKRSADGGVSWGADTRLTDNSSGSNYPSISVSGLVVHVVWGDYRDGNMEIYCKRSSDGGVGWGADTRLTNNSATSEFPSVSISGSVPVLAFHVVWQDNRNGNYEIYYKRSTNAGVSWEADTRLTNNSAYSGFPSVAVSGSAPALAVHVAWMDHRDGNNEIYYKRDSTGNINGIKNINLEVQKEFSLGQNYPNPFNPVTNINFSIPKSGLVKLVVFDLIGCEVSVLANDFLSAGNYTVDFDASNLASGVYFYKIVSGEFSDVKKMILVK